MGPDAGKIESPEQLTANDSWMRTLIRIGTDITDIFVQKIGRHGKKVFPNETLLAPKPNPTYRSETFLPLYMRNGKSSKNCDSTLQWNAIRQIYSEKKLFFVFWGDIGLSVKILLFCLK